MTERVQTFDTIEKASAHQARVDTLDRALQAMTPAERAEWFAMNGGNIDDILETVE